MLFPDHIHSPVMQVQVRVQYLSVSHWILGVFVFWGVLVFVLFLLKDITDADKTINKNAYVK